LPLLEEEKVRIRSHLGFLNVADAATFVLGVPSSVQTQFIIEGAMNRVLESALPLLREFLAHLDRLRGQRMEAGELLDVKRLGDIEIDPDLQKKRDREYDGWADELANLLGVMRNPFDKRLSGRGLSVPVAH
jgi:hypothetical protein